MRNGSSFLPYLKSPKNTLPRVRRLNISQKATIWSLELENIRSLGKKLIESGKVTKILEILQNNCEILKSTYFEKHLQTAVSVD